MGNEESRRRTAVLTEPSRVRQHLQELADENRRVEVHVLEPTGGLTEVGIARVRYFLEDSSLLVMEQPTSQGKPQRLSAAKPVSLTFRAGERLLRCATQIVQQKLWGGLFLAVVVRAPTQLEDANRRRHFRVEPPISKTPKVRWRPRTAEAGTEIPWIDTHIKNFSGRGLGVLIPEKVARALRLNLELDFEIRLPDHRDPLALSGTVRQISPASPPSGLVLVGVEFDVASADPDAVVQPIANYVAECERVINRNRRLKQ